MDFRHGGGDIKFGVFQGYYGRFELAFEFGFYHVVVCRGGYFMVA